MNQGGKHAAAEPGRVENKRERRRGAAGRAAVLRRAPSDSDCSGETASLSADSGDRAPRPAPLAPPRSGKTRSRRRGSEWEVLEGLKDGQRFEKRPDVFNGYLHKKRKWPLKGWHKRFFVVDGGILVYARSPTDVARGRLHGSVDVGLSVISAKARRRRIDIDADEFIYHLRAKTPDVFRTWLNVLKAHRLYRQHLLTFGARESVPKIHPPLEDLPPTDTSSHTSFTSNCSTETSNLDDTNHDASNNETLNIPLDIDPSEYSQKHHSSILDWQRDAQSNNSLIPLNFESLEQKMFDLKLDDNLYHNKSLCSMKCVARRYIEELKRRKSPNISLNTTDAEKQMGSTDLDFNSLKTIKKLDASIDKTRFPYKANMPNITSVPIRSIDTKVNIALTCQNDIPDRKRSPFMNSSKKPLTTCFFFTRKRNKIVNSNDNDNSPMKKSKKCTNLVKYKNVSDEPPLKNQSSKCMLLGKYKLTATKHVDTTKTKDKTVACDPICKENNEAQVTMINTENKASQIVSTIADYDIIAEKLMISIFRRSGGNRSKDVKFCIDQVVQDLYDIKVDQEIHPVRALFKNLLEYWMKTTSVSQFKQAMTTEKSVDKQSINYFTRDENLSSLLVEMKTKETQFCGRTEVSTPFKSTIQNNGVRQKVKCEMKIPVEMMSKPKAGSESSGKERCVIKEHSKVTVKYKSNKNSKCEPKIPTEMYLSPRRDTESFEKEKRIQELERLLRSTVYMCETERTNINKEKDIKITKKLIDNLGKVSQNNCFSTYDEKPVIQKSSSSAELPEIQDTINHLISETCIPPDVAKEFLGAYLDVLLQDRSKSTTSLSSDWDKQSQDIPECEVVAEAVIKKVSKSMTTLNILNDTRKENLPVQPTKNVTEKQIDPGQVYLKDILDKVTTIFSRVSKIEDGKAKQESKLNNSLTYNKNIRKPIIQDELGRPVFKYKSDLIYENSDENSLVIDLSKYHLEHISMDSDPAVKDMMSITIKLKEKPPNHGESKQTHLSLKFPDDLKQIVSNVDKSDNWLPFRNPNSSASADIFRKLPLNKLTCLDFEAKRDIADPFLSNSDGTSKAFDPRDKSHNSLDDSPINAMMDQKENEDLQSCYIMSIKKGSLSSMFQSKKKGNLKPCDCDAIVIKSREHSPNKSASKRSDELSMFERPAPRIIDEKFILLLLENLTFLSRNVPTLHKDINALYLKLKKKHEKIVKNCNNMQGLSLLGKIYSEDSGSKDGDDRGTQYDPKENQEYCKSQKKTKNASTNTTISKGEEKCECTFKFLAPIFHVEVQTSREINDGMLSPMPNNENTKQNQLNANLNVTKEVPESSTSNRERMVVTETETIDIDTTSQSTSNPNWFKTLTIDVAMNTQETKTLEQSSSNDPPATAPKEIKIARELKKMRNLPKVKRDLFKEIPLLGPLFKVSTQSQTERQFIRFGAGKRPNRDFHIYQLYLSKKYELKQSSSMILTSSLDHRISDEIKTLYRCSSDPSNCSGLLSPTTPTLRGPQAGFVSGTPGGRLAGWIIESGGPLENASRELGQAQLSVQQLQRLLDALELQQQVHHDTDVSLEGASPNVKKDRRKFGLRKKKSSSKCASVELAPPHIDLSSSHTALSSLSTLTAPPSPGGGPGSMPNCAASLPIACAAARPQSLPGAESLNTAPGPASLTSLTPDHQLREDFTVLAKDLVASLKGIVSSLVCERGRLRAALEAAESTATPGGAVMAALRTNLTSALQQNSELRSRLSRIHDVSDIAEIMSAANSEAVNRQFQQSLSYSSSCVSASEFFDAEEHEEDDLKPDDVIAADEAGVIELDGDSSSEAGSLSSEEGSASSDNSEAAMLSAEQSTLRHSAPGWARRTRLPAPRPSPGGPSLWNLLYKNIGKDLSQISMPVTINEPLNMLQRLCEELEYSELLDAASACSNAVERMCLVAAFAVSAYAGSAHRAASKPFNPLLGETYECVRDDRSFRFIAEQVSHHPPISACHAESPRWSFWQEARIKTKFWGKSMEFQPTGQVHVRLATTGDHYTWNKVTTCVHNLFGGQRWVDQYGDMHIVCRGTDISAKLNFIKASSWSQSRHEVRGAVAQAAGPRVRVAGRWSEALYAGEPPAARCLWRPGAMPPEHELYYGFTRFAMELNEMEPAMREVLPHTDTRFRPDQRALEEGAVEAAEGFKHELEQAQRERRRENLPHRPAWFRKTFEDGEETWVFSGEYWKAREAGFSEHDVPRIW